ncbi:hypothetical protein PG991_012505 [Apiospora marii]|uniref:Uncharacterized protein n=1 Tax=Apiospora marii TaxID=335849 RepID=A0ABR1RA09_9PEZI
MDQEGGGEKPSTTDLVSAVGTWLAVGLAVIALVGVVGPILVWRATKGERNRAINAIEEGEAESFGYVGRGLWAGRRMRLFRRVSNPLLQNEPDLGDNKHFAFQAPPDSPQQAASSAARLFGWKHKAGSSSKPQPSNESTDWVQFGSLAEAYSIPMKKGDNLVVEDGRAWLPVHTSWLLLLGLLGRYGPWQDKGRLPPTIARGTASNQARVGTLRQRSTGRPRSLPTSRPWEKSHTPWEDAHDRRSFGSVTYNPLYGLEGTLFTPSHIPRDTGDQKRVFFSRHRANRTGQLTPNKYGVDLLFWMAVGCIPTSSGDILCLADVQDVPVIQELRTASRTTLSAPSPGPAMPSRRNVHFDEDVEQSGSEDYAAPSLNDVAYQQISPAAYITPHSSGPELTVSYDPGRPRVFELAPWSERNADLSDFAAVVKADSTEKRVLSFRETALTEEQVRDILSASAGTYMDRGSDWLRLWRGGMDGGYARFMSRRDGQLLAHALLTLDLSPHGYLMSLERSHCRSMLCDAASSLPQLLTRSLWSIDALDLSDDDDLKTRLGKAMAKFYDLSQPAVRTRLYFAALYELDAALQEATRKTERAEQLAAQALGCVMLTSPEFRSIIAQATRLLAEGFGGNTAIVVNLDAGVIEVPTVLNFVCRFPIETEVLLDGVEPADGSGSVRLSLACVVLVCQRAALRSAMLDSALDSEPLFRAVTSLGQTVLMG